YEAALDDLDHVLAERPGHLDALSLRSVVYEKLAAKGTGAQRAELLNRSYVDARNAVTIDSTDKDVKWAMKHLGKTRAPAPEDSSASITHVIDEAQFLDSYNAGRAEQHLQLMHKESGVALRLIHER